MGILQIIESGQRMVAATLLDRCGVMDRIQVADGTGGVTESYVARDSDTPCRFVRPIDTAGPRTANLSNQSGSMEGFASMSVLLPIGTDLPELSKVWASDGRAFLVVGDETPPSALITVERALLRELGVSA